jgi:methionyl-tRNA synthetase
MTIFRVFSTGHKSEYVLEDDLESVLCGSCHGELKKKQVDSEFDYLPLKKYILQCQSCGGKYRAIELSKEEMAPFLRNK